jgi:hypothetical protein
MALTHSLITYSTYVEIKMDEPKKEDNVAMEGAQENLDENRPDPNQDRERNQLNIFDSQMEEE